MQEPAASQSIALAPCDIAIVGGGLVGCSLFLALKESGLRVSLIEARVAANTVPARDARHLALNACSIDTLIALGVSLDLQSASVISRIRINRAGEFGRVDLTAAEHGLAHFGQLIAADQLGTALQLAVAKACATSALMQRIQPARLVSLFIDESEAKLGLALGENDASDADKSLQTLHAQLVIGADGSHSAVRTLTKLGAQSKIRDYQQSALVFNFSSDQNIDGLALERFTDTGPLAVLPIPNRRLGAVWTLPNDQALALQANPSQLINAFQRALGSTYGRVSQLSKSAIWPLHLNQCQPSTAHRTALIGNAAQTIHPLGAQGFNLGLRDAVQMAKYLAQLGDPADLAKRAAMPDFFADFAALRATDRENTIAFSDGLLSATSSKTGLSKALRGFGLALLASNPLLQRDIIRFGVGFARAG